jgi:hypothetical protein
MGQHREIFSNNTHQPHSGETSKGFGLGDAVASVTHALGIPECGGCARRRELFNRLLRVSSAPDPLTAYILSKTPHKNTLHDQPVSHQSTP